MQMTFRAVGSKRERARQEYKESKESVREAPKAQRISTGAAFVFWDVKNGPPSGN